jgi:hypothetical protein
LPEGKQRDERTAALGEEFEGDGRVYGDVAAETERSEEVDATDSAVVVLWSGL